MDLSVIIVNYNVRQFLENLLVSLQRAMEGLSGEIIVVDNASDDGSVEMVREKFPSVCLIPSSSNAGFARANNIALRQSKGDYLLLLNPDTIVQEDTLTVMVRFLREHPAVGLAGCKILNPDGSFQLSCKRSFPTPWVSFTRIFGLSSLFPQSRLFGRYNLTYLDADATYPVDAVSGSFMMISRAAYERVGGLDEAFFMYGEDLDYCFRVQESGLRVYYVHETRIVHFKGESTRRSDLDEIRVFYDAMRIFVRKHFARSGPLMFVLSLGISLRAAAAFLSRTGRTMALGLVDFLVVLGAMIAGEKIRHGELFHFPSYAYPSVWIVPPLVVVTVSYFIGAYTSHRYSVSRSGMGVVLGFVLIAATVFFARDYAFSRIVVAIAGLISTLTVPGWRLLLRLSGSASAPRSSRRSLFGRRTVIVGTGRSAQEVLRKLRARVADGYEVLGFVSTNRRDIGERIAGVEVLGSIDNIGRVVATRKVTEVIFSTDGLSYTDILSVIGRSNTRGVNFRLVPNSLEAIIGKASIDELDSLPMVEIEYNIHRPANRFVKRTFDILASAILLITVYPWASLFFLAAGRPSNRARPWILFLPGVFSGSISFVGLPFGREERGVPPSRGNGQTSYLGPYGLTGLVQINSAGGLTQEELEKLKLYYAKNQSLILDLEILAKSLMTRRGKTV
jgi:hypothetical protein